MSRHFMKLLPTREQKEIRDSRSARIIAEANAGAAKTTTAAMRIAALIERGANPKKILALSFTLPGVSAYEEAFKRVGLPGDVVAQLRCGTIDDFCAARLRKVEREGVRRYDRPERVRGEVVSSIATARTRMEERFPGAFSLFGQGELAVEGLLEEFGQIKGSMAIEEAGEYFSLTPSSAEELGFNFTTLAVFKAYEQQRIYASGDGELPRFRYKGDATYDLARMLISDDPPFNETSHPMRLDLEAVILDEMHDCNLAIFTMLQRLLELNEGCSFLGVGDRDQVIHAKDGADSRFMKDQFDRQIGVPERLPLTMTHRFGNALAQPLGTFSRKKYVADDSRGSAVEIKETEGAEDLLHVIREAIQSRRGLDADSTAHDIAVLLRHPGRFVELEHLLIRKDVHYETVGFKCFVERPEILFMRMILTAAVKTQGRFDTATLSAAKRHTWEFIGGRLPSASMEETEAIVEQASEKDFLDSVLPYLLEDTRAGSSSRIMSAIDLASKNQTETLPAMVEVLDIQRFASAAFVRSSDVEDVKASISGLCRIARNYESIRSLLEALLQIDYGFKARRREGQRIVLSTVEASKGLEFDHVILPNMNRRAFDGQATDERNLFYVAASRARNRMTFTHKPGQASSYLSSYLAK